jgi:cytochrome c oxidase subunit 2
MSRQPRRSTTRWRTSIGVLAASAIVSLTGCAEQLGLPGSASKEGKTVGQVFNLYLVVAYVIGAIVVGLIIYVMVSGRASRHGDGPGSQRHYNTPLEITYTVIPLLIVVALTVVTLFTIADVASNSSKPDLVVEVQGYQWGWRFTYADHGVVIADDGDTPPELVLPAPATVRFNVRSDDVIHSFWVPAFRFKRDLIPGRPTSFSVDTSEFGTYDGHCAEFCGLKHATMTFTVRTVGQQDFQTWLKDHEG